MKRLLLKINNFWVRRRRRALSPGEVLLLVPRCLQNSECTARVALDPGECRRCGRCHVGDLVELARRYGIGLVVATGGGIALRELSRPEIKAVVSVACANELFQGMVRKKGKPALVVEISRPQGPCRDTAVDVAKVEREIGCFLGG